MSGDGAPAVVFDQVFKAFGPNQVLRKRVVFGSGRERPLHPGQERHWEERDAQTPHLVGREVLILDIHLQDLGTNTKLFPVRNTHFNE